MNWIRPWASTQGHLLVHRQTDNHDKDKPEGQVHEHGGEPHSRPEDASPYDDIIEKTLPRPSRDYTPVDTPSDERTKQ